MNVKIRVHWVMQEGIEKMLRCERNVYTNKQASILGGKEDYTITWFSLFETSVHASLLQIVIAAPHALRTNVASTASASSHGWSNVGPSPF